jgi:hypothetical protein
MSGRGVRPSAAAGRRLSGVLGRVQEGGEAMRCSWTQLDLMGHDPKPASRWPGILRDYGRHTDRTRHSRRAKWRSSRSVTIPMGRNARSVKPSAKPTLVRTQHLPLKTPGQTRCRCSRRPGLMRVRERFGRPFPVAVGQLWARSGLVSGLWRTGARDRPSGAAIREPASPVGISTGHRRLTGSGRRFSGPAVSR